MICLKINVPGRKIRLMKQRKEKEREGTSACVLVNVVGSCLSGGHVHVWWCVLGCL